jgi:hypothetical protein
MARVDPDDDNIRRYVVRHYAFDPDRYERRHGVVAAFDDEGEFMELIHRRKEDVDRRRSTGEELSALDYYSGVALEPGYRRRVAIQRLALKAIERGVSLSEATLAWVDWYPNNGFVGPSQTRDLKEPRNSDLDVLATVQAQEKPFPLHVFFFVGKAKSDVCL